MRPSLSKLTGIFFRIGNTTFGGGYVAIGMLGREFEARGWLTRDKFDLAFALSRVTPGTNVLAFCAAVGSLLRGWAGAVAAVLAVAVPSALIALLLIYGLEAGQNNRVAMAAIGGTVAAVAGMMWSTIWTILRPHMGSFAWNLRAAAIAGGAFVASWWWGMSPFAIILFGGLLGLLWHDGAAGE